MDPRPGAARSSRPSRRPPRPRPSRRARWPGGDGGQATVELALGLPVLLLGLLLVVQAGLVVAGHVATVHAAREAARAVAVDGRPGAGPAAVAATGRRGCRTEVDRPPDPGQVLHVTVSCPVATDVPLVGPLLPEVTARARSAMRVER